MVSVKQLRLKGKRVFIRCDFNVPMKNGRITDNYRVVQALETIKYALKKGATQIILASHLGRPKGIDRAYSLAPVAKELSTLLHRTVYLHKDLTLPVAPFNNIGKNRVVLLENLRFYEGEQKGTLSFAKQLARNADVYINDAFGTSHRKDASMFALAKLLPSAYGFLIEKELQFVHLKHKKPVVAIFGAAKIGDKLPLLKKMLDHVDKVIITGGVVFTFLAAAGVEVGKSLVDEKKLRQAKQLLNAHGSKLVFPIDFVCAAPSKVKSFSKLTVAQRKVFITTVDVTAIRKTQACYDVGPKSVKLYMAVLSRAKTILWNGPLGMFEVKPFDVSTNKLAKQLGDLDATVVVCGGDTASAVRHAKVAHLFTHVSTGGGASLQLLGGEKLPALEVLKN